MSTPRPSGADLCARHPRAAAAILRDVVNGILPPFEPLDPIWIGTVREHEWNTSRAIRAKFLTQILALEAQADEQDAERAAIRQAAELHVEMSGHPGMLQPSDLYGGETD